MKEKLLKKLAAELKKKKLQALATEIGIGYGTLYRFLYEGASGTVKSWDKIESYYRNKKSL